MALVLKGPIKIKIADTRTTFFVRTALNEERVQFFMDLYSGKTADVKPIIVTLHFPHEVIEGRHRLEAQTRLGMTEIFAFTTKIEDRAEMILEAVRANTQPQAPLPSTPSDLRYVIDLLLTEGMPLKELLERFPLDKATIRRYYEDVRDNRKRRTLGRAVEFVLEGGVSLDVAAEKFKVKVDELRDFIKTRKERAETVNANAVGGLLAQVIRPASAVVARQTARMIQAYQRGEVDAKELELIATRLNVSGKRFLSTANQAANRLLAAVAEGNLALAVDYAKNAHRNGDDSDA